VGQGRRPQGYYEFEWTGPRPAYAVERSTLWRAGVLTGDERDELLAGWRREFDAVQGQSARVRREAFEHHDIPDELVREWTSQKKGARSLAKLSSAEGKEPNGRPPL